MDLEKINVEKYLAEIKKNFKLEIADETIRKDLFLTLLLAEMEKEQGIFQELIFKGGTLLSRNYLSYHRFSEDLDFVYIHSNSLRELSRKERERKIKVFIDLFVPKLKNISDTLNLDFSLNRSDIKYCKVLSGRAVYVFKMYYSTNRYIKLEINFIEKVFYTPERVGVKMITDFFDSRELKFILGLEMNNFTVPSYVLKEIVLEKYRAVLTRHSLKERDLFDLFLIPNSLEVNLKEVVEKIKCSALLKKELKPLIENKYSLLKKNEFFVSDEKVEDFAIIKYDTKSFTDFKEKVKPILIEVCEQFLENEK